MGFQGAREYYKEHPHVDVVPFESMHKFMAVLVDLEKSENEAERVQMMRTVIVKGAFDVLVELCPLQMNERGEMQAIKIEYWRKVAQHLASSGLRVIAMAQAEVNQEVERITVEDIVERKVLGLRLVCLVGILDPPRPEAIAAVSKCNAAGITVKMITGKFLSFFSCSFPFLSFFHPFFLIFLLHYLITG